MKTPLFMACAAAFAAASCSTVPYAAPPYAATVAPVAPHSPVALTTATKSPFGSYLVDGSGRSVYLLDGTRWSSARMACGYDCARVWPPVPAAAMPNLGAGLDPRRLGTAPGTGGLQLTYQGWPLYYYINDRAPGDTTGQNVQDRWGRWYLISPSGEPIQPGY